MTIPRVRTELGTSVLWSGNLGYRHCHTYTYFRTFCPRETDDVQFHVPQTEFKNMFKVRLVCGTQTLINMDNLYSCIYFLVLTRYMYITRKTLRVAIFHWTFGLPSGVRL